MARIERTNEKYQRAMVKRIQRLAAEKPVATFDNVEDLMRWLDDEAPKKPKKKLR